MKAAKDIAEQSTHIAVGLAALSTPVATGIAPALVGAATLVAIGYSLRKSCANRACTTAVETILNDMKGRPGITDAHLTRAASLIAQAPDSLRLDPAALAAQVQNGTIVAEGTKLVLDALPFDGTEYDVRSILELALNRAIAVCTATDAFDTALKRELLLKAAQDHGLMLTLLQDIDDTTKRTEAKLDELLRRMGGFENAAAQAETLATQDLKTLAAAFGETTLTDRAALTQFLTQKADEYTAFKATIDGLDDRVAAIANLKGAAQHAAETLNFDEVEELLSRVDEVETEIAAETKLARARNALLRNNPNHAFQILSAAADSFASIDPLEPACKRLDYAALLYEHGLRYAGSALRLCADMNHAALARVSRDLDASLWAKLQNNLGIALQSLGDRTGDPDTLRSAVDAYTAALEVYTREASEMAWAMTQNNLGNALQSLGDRTGDPDTLRCAIDAYTAALKVRTREASEMAWAMTQNNLGIALKSLGNRTGDPDTLRRAIDAYTAALEVYTREASEMHWAATQNNLGIALKSLGDRTGDPDTIRRAIDAYEAALEVRTREASEMQWAATRNNLGNALADLGSRTGDPDTIRRAIDAFEAALEVYTRQASEMDWAMTQNNLGIALKSLGDRTGDPDTIRRAIDAYTAALKVRTREASEMAWAMTQNNLGIALKSLGNRTGDPDTLRRAIDAYTAALEVYTREASEMHWAATQNNLGIALKSLGDRTGDPDTIRRAIDAYDAALEVYTRDASEMDWAMTHGNIAQAQLILAPHLPDSAARAALDAALASVDNALDIWTPTTAAQYHTMATDLRADILAARDG